MHYKKYLFVTSVLLCSCACNKQVDLTTTDSYNTELITIDSATIKGDFTTNNLKAPSQLNNTKKFTNYLIKKGDHYSQGNSIQINTYSNLRFKAILDSTCIYKTVQPANQEDINKLFGFSDCSSHHQTNSARFGWNWDNGALQIHAYCYSGGVRSYRKLGTVKVNEEFDCQIKLLADKYLFALNGDTVMMDRGCTGSSTLGYQLYPYFGGDETAPHDINVRIKTY